LPVLLWPALLLLVVTTVAAQQTAPSTPGWLEIETAALEARPANDEYNREQGRRLYNFRCAGCHGTSGEGNGPAAEYLDPRPRDFLFANFKMRTTEFSELPLDEDLYRTITRGIPGTAMPSWATLEEDERWQLVYWIRYLARDYFDDEDFDPRRVDDDGHRYLVKVPGSPPVTDELLEQGRQAFDKGRCVECHGPRGLGNGTSAGTQFNYLEQRILPRDLSKGWRYKGGSRVEDIWRTLTAGMNGTPMPSFVGALDESDPDNDARLRWALAHYVDSLAVDEATSGGALLTAEFIQADLPSDPADPAWQQAGEIAFRLMGQVIRRPRWEIAAVDQVRVRALYNESTIAFRLEYHDRSMSAADGEQSDVTPEIDQGPTYPGLDVEDFEFNRALYNDAVALQFPAREQQGARRPYFLYGSIDNPVKQWRHIAGPDGQGSMQALEAGGPARQSWINGSGVTGSAVYDDGVWAVVLSRSLEPDRGKGPVFTPGGTTAFSVMAWDGSNGETGLRQSLSPWYSLYLEAPLAVGDYATAGVVGLLVALAELLMLRRAGRERGGTGDADA